MATYFPFLRGKREELFALKHLATRIANSTGAVCPIIEPVKDNGITRSCLEVYAERKMPFVFITNPLHGDYKGDENTLYANYTLTGPLADYETFHPALYVGRETTVLEANRFVENYKNMPFRAVIYTGEPADEGVRHWCTTDLGLYYHIAMDGRVSASFLRNIPQARRVIIRDHFNRQERNSDYPASEHFTDWNTTQGNKDGFAWGDYSIQGDHYTHDRGGPAYAVTLHHIHRSEDDDSLKISHYISDDQETTANPSGKTIQAVKKLVADLDGLIPNDTVACATYRDMAESEHARGLGHMKRLAILHHLEIMLGDE
jgi:hypothetical protein